MELKPFVIEANHSAPDLAFGAAQRTARRVLVGDRQTGSITHKNHFTPVEYNPQYSRESLSEVALRLVHADNCQFRALESAARYITDGFGYYVFFGWAPPLEEK